MSPSFGLSVKSFTVVKHENSSLCKMSDDSKSISSKLNSLHADTNTNWKAYDNGYYLTYVWSIKAVLSLNHSSAKFNRD